MKWMTNGKTAVISGGASGIGLELCKRFLACGMNVVIADVKNLTSAKESLEISNDESKVLIQEFLLLALMLKELEIFVQESFGKVHCLMGNAGMIAMGTKPWEEVEQLAQNHEYQLYGGG